MRRPSRKSGARTCCSSGCCGWIPGTRLSTTMVSGGMGWGWGGGWQPFRPTMVPVQQVSQYDLATVESNLFDVQTKQLVWAATTIHVQSRNVGGEGDARIRQRDASSLSEASSRANSGRAAARQLRSFPWLAAPDNPPSCRWLDPHAVPLRPLRGSTSMNMKAHGSFILLLLLAFPVAAAEPRMICFGNEPSWGLHFSERGGARLELPDARPSRIRAARCAPQRTWR